MGISVSGEDEVIKIILELLPILVYWKRLKKNKRQFFPFYKCSLQNPSGKILTLSHAGWIALFIMAISITNKAGYLFAARRICSPRYTYIITADVTNLVTLRSIVSYSHN